MAGADRTDTERVVELAPKAGALRLWSEIVRSLSQAGYEQAGPEYLRLSKLLIETRTAELVNGQDLTDAGWTQLREQAAEALRLLEPLVESARLLATLPDTIEIANPPDKPSASEAGVAGNSRKPKAKPITRRRRRKGPKSTEVRKTKD